MPLSSRKYRAQVSTQAAVLPAEIIASARPSATARAATRSEASRRFFTASCGSSSMPIASRQSTIEMCSGL